MENNMHQVKISNIPSWITEIHLKQYFNSCGKIISAKIALDPNTLRSLGHGFVTFADEEAAQHALDKSGCSLDGAELQIDTLEPVAE